MHIAVLGGGIVGVTSAWYLRAAGHHVTLIERQPGVALETSFANGSQVSAGHAEPWAQPGVWRKVLRWLPQEDAPLLFRLRLDAAQWRWGLQFLRECAPQRFAYNLRQILALGVYSRQSLRALRAELGLDYDQAALGILNLYETRADFARAVAVSALVRDFGYERVALTPDEVIAREPVLRHRRAHLAGGTWTPPDETGDAHQFARALADAAIRAGVTLCCNTQVTGLVVRNGQLRSVQLIRDVATAPQPADLAVDACVLALGSHSVRLLRPLGIEVPIYPAKGYSVTLPLRDPDRMAGPSITDESSKMVFTRLGQRLRVAGTAEFGGYGLELNPVRCAALVARARLLFPGAADDTAPVFWTGLRPATPSNRPLIGATRVAGLYLNAGHGTLGWTESCGSARALSRLIDGLPAEVDFDLLQHQHLR